MVRASGIGFFLGLLPGCAPAVTTFIAYDVEKRVSKTPERFGKGAIEGVAAPEGGNNATSSGGLRLLFLNLPLVGFWARIALIPFPVLGPIIILCSIIGAYSIRFLLFDVWVTLVFGVIGYLMRKLGFPMAPMVLATVLAPMLEVSLQQSLLLSLGSPFIFFHRPLAAFFMALAL